MSHPTQTPYPRADEHTEEQRIDAARRYVLQLQAFYIHAGVFAAGMILIFVVNLATNVSAGIAGEWWAWWSAWAFLGWGVGVAIHGLVVLLNRPAHSSSTWEQQQIDKVLAR